MRRTRSPWIAWKIADATIEDHEEQADNRQAGEIGRRDDLVDEDPGGDRDRQAEERADKRHEEDHPELASPGRAGSG